ncbi:hypothetical protein LXL04_037869 [Taraxacum kok-saghyz]
MGKNVPNLSTFGPSQRQLPIKTGKWTKFNHRDRGDLGFVWYRMGNKLGRRRQVVDEKYTRPQGLYQHKDVDHKKLRKLILDSKLAPCYPGDDDCSCDLEECPICFLYYPNRGVARKASVPVNIMRFKYFIIICKQIDRILTFSMFPADEDPKFYTTNAVSLSFDKFLFFSYYCSKFHVSRFKFLTVPRCPFCKTLNYAVEYRGVKTKEEKGQEQIEEQRVIEAKIRMRQQEIQDEEERMLKKQERSSSSRIIDSNESEYFSRPARSSSEEGEEIVSAPNSGLPPIRHPQPSRDIRDDEFDLDPENIMLMEAIWLSFQEDGKNQRHTPNYGDAAQLAKYATEVGVLASMAPHPEQPQQPSSSSASSSPSGGLACAIAALAERQQTGGGGESSTNYNYNANTSSTYNIMHDPECTSSLNTLRLQDVSSWGESESIRHEQIRECETSFGYIENNSNTLGGYMGGHDEVVDGGYGGGGIVPESFEEQMMLAMAVSLAEARARSSSAQEVAWI